MECPSKLEYENAQPCKECCVYCWRNAQVWTKEDDELEEDIRVVFLCGNYFSWGMQKCWIETERALKRLDRNCVNRLAQWVLFNRTRLVDIRFLFSILFCTKCDLVSLGGRINDAFIAKCQRWISAYGNRTIFRDELGFYRAILTFFNPEEHARSKGIRQSTLFTVFAFRSLVKKDVSVLIGKAVYKTRHDSIWK